MIMVACSFGSRTTILRSLRSYVACVCSTQLDGSDVVAELAPVPTAMHMIKDCT